MRFWSRFVGALVRRTQQSYYALQRSHSVLLLPLRAAREPAGPFCGSPRRGTPPAPGAPPGPPEPSPHQRIIEKNLPWLRATWAELQRQREAGVSTLQGEGFFAELTEWQRD